MIGIDHFQDSVFDSSSTQGCTFSMHSLYNASLACGGYDYVAAKGTDPLPVFQASSPTARLYAELPRVRCCLPVLGNTQSQPASQSSCSLPFPSTHTCR